MVPLLSWEFLNQPEWRHPRRDRAHVLPFGSCTAFFALWFHFRSVYAYALIAWLTHSPIQPRDIITSSRKVLSEHTLSLSGSCVYGRVQCRIHETSPINARPHTQTTMHARLRSQIRAFPIVEVCDSTWQQTNILLLHRVALIQTFWLLQANSCEHLVLKDRSAQVWNPQPWTWI